MALDGAESALDWLGDAFWSCLLDWVQKKSRLEAGNGVLLGLAASWLGFNFFEEVGGFWDGGLACGAELGS